MPRIKNLKDQQLYRPSKHDTYGIIDPLLSKTIDIECIKEQLDQMIRVAASLKSKIVPAHDVIRRLSKSSAPADKLSKAFTNLGRLLKTQYILQYITRPFLRSKVQSQLNKGEHRHALSRWIFFANQGKFQTGDYEEIMNKASCLSLVSNAVLYWNTVKMMEIIEVIRAQNYPAHEETLSHISPLMYKHVIPMGTYIFGDAMESEFII